MREREKEQLEWQEFVCCTWQLYPSRFILKSRWRRRRERNHIGSNKFSLLFPSLHTMTLISLVWNESLLLFRMFSPGNSLITCISFLLLLLLKREFNQTSHIDDELFFVTAIEVEIDWRKFEKQIISFRTWQCLGFTNIISNCDWTRSEFSIITGWTANPHDWFPRKKSSLSIGSRWIPLCHWSRWENHVHLGISFNTSRSIPSGINRQFDLWIYSSDWSRRNGSNVNGTFANLFAKFMFQWRLWNRTFVLHTNEMYPC